MDKEAVMRSEKRKKIRIVQYIVTIPFVCHARLSWLQDSLCTHQCTHTCMSGYYIFQSLPCPRWQVPHPSDDPPVNHLAEQLAVRERDCIATANPFS
ncbi:hypothetical protein PAXRUDRAFT_603770 [Paxillus rubicundulus Ve08.2h10]|uniref:Uncharacterized protein n=1 Tax=Paxillus rubicundulus Ve08.2h10 TaxID=930991 RepID=A0A0D0CCW3_9AGAM|nr:hypothetical protein PAXRUDRAFT_603770 [Paxillus rubicundulus Ve08.2h10]